MLHLLHAAHQGIDRMKGRASRCVFWPGIVSDICRIRESCAACHKMAKSNPSLPPYPPPEPEYPFQYLSADYFNFKGKEYCVVVDRYSHWPVVLASKDGARSFTKCLREMFSTFEVPEEIATDGATIFTGGLTQEFLRNWGVKYRVSSVANPHSNCRAEVAVKQVKRALVGNVDESCNLNKDSFQKAMLSHRNMPDQFTKMSPAKAVFGRDVRDGMPILRGKYNPHECWKETLDNREKALARRRIHGVERWSEHTKPLPKLSLGDDVYIQNLVGNHPRRWERTGKIVECKDFDQYNVKIDGTGRCMLRNRKHIRKFTPVSLSKNASPVIPSQIQTSPYVEPPAAVDFVILNYFVFGDFVTGKFFPGGFCRWGIFSRGVLSWGI